MERMDLDQEFQLKRQKIAFDECCAIHMLARGTTLDGETLSRERMEELRRCVPLGRRAAFETDVPPFVPSVIDPAASKMSQYDMEATRLKVVIAPMLTSSGGLQQKSVASFVEEMGKAELEGEIHFLLVQVLGRSDSPGVRSRFVEVGGLDKLLRFLNEGSVRKLSNVVLWVLRVLEKLPFSNTLMNHPVARIVRTISLNDSSTTKDLASTAFNLLRVWKREHEAAEARKNGRPLNTSSNSATKPMSEDKKPAKPPAAKAAPSSSSATGARTASVSAKTLSSAKTVPKSVPKSAPAKPVPAKVVPVAPTPAASTSSFSSMLIDSGASSGPVVKKKKKRVLPLKADVKTDPGEGEVPKKPLLAAAAAAGPGKKARIVPLDSNGELLDLTQQESKRNLTVEAVPVVLSADEIIARQKPRAPAASSGSKAFTPAAMAARMRDERAQAALGSSREAMSGSKEGLDELVFGGSDVGPSAGVGDEEEEPSKRKKSNKRVSFPPDDKLASIRTYVPENPSKMISTRSVIQSGVRQLAKLDARHERDLKTAKSEEVTARDLARRMEAQINWYKPTEIKVEYSAEDEPPKHGEESTEKNVQKKREETRLARVYNDRNPPPDDPDEAPPEPENDDSTVRVVYLDKEEPKKDAAITNLMNMFKPVEGLPVLAPIASLAAVAQRTFLPVNAQPVRAEPPRQEIRQNNLPPNMCLFFKNGKGRCSFGNNCKFSHAIIP